jgi:hypothetical protein
MSKQVSKLQEVNAFLGSERGRYILSQALCVAIRSLKRVPKERREASNIADMEYLVENAFPMFRMLEKATRLFKLKKEKENEGNQSK